MLAYCIQFKITWITVKSFKKNEKIIDIQDSHFKHMCLDFNNINVEQNMA